MDRKHFKRYMLALTIFSLLVQGLTNITWAPEAMGRLLVLKSMGGFDGGPPAFSYMVIGEQTLSQLSARQRGGVEKTLKARGTKLLLHEGDVPPENKVYIDEDGKPQFVGYKDASKNNWTIHARFPCYFRASYGNYTGNLGAFGTEGRFVWFLGKWFKVWSGSVIMA
jgi:hypothetical protein